MLRERLRATAVIEMPVRQQNLLDAHALPAHFSDDPIDVAAGIDNSRASRRFALTIEQFCWKGVTGTRMRRCKAVCKSAHCTSVVIRVVLRVEGL